MKHNSIYLTVLENIATSVKDATEKGETGMVAVLDTHLKTLADQISRESAKEGEVHDTAQDKSPFWLGQDGCTNLTWWWLRKKEEGCSQTSQASEKMVLEKKHSPHKNSQDHKHQTEEVPLMESDAVVDYLKHRTAPNVIEQLRQYSEDLQEKEKANPRIMEELDLTMRWVEGDTADEVVHEYLDVKTLYPSPRDLLVDDVLHALREYRQTLLTYGAGYKDETALYAISKMFHRDGKPEKAKPVEAKEAPKLECVPYFCSCGEDCHIASFPRLPSPSYSPVPFQEQQMIQNAKTFDYDLGEWSTYLEEQMRAYRYFILKGGRVDEGIVRKAAMILTLAKGKFKEDKTPDEIEEIMHQLVPGSWVEDGQGETEDAESENKIDNSDDFEVDESHFDHLAEQLRYYYNGVYDNSDRAEVDGKVLNAAKKLVEKAGQVQSHTLVTENRETSSKINLKTIKAENKGQDASEVVDGDSKPAEITPNFSKEAREIESIFPKLNEDPQDDSQLVEASKKLIDVVKESEDAGYKLEENPQVLQAARKVLKLAKDEDKIAEPNLAEEKETLKKIKRKKTVRFASELVQILGEKGEKKR